ncbi:2-phospho-L-lactate guanylyltransferase [Halobacterium sp. KA-4]|jgi:2-phospho-L-lactate guanylyltransferase|uniref:2-phospho-L-lactate guanylyltransferase n=1 Tax=Halobacterium sp. KA-4 TaxID=2896367 RepID=UPI001E29BC33|nr:2-phospho-L-lactate guanylyltransferase [Halobacterium sp. KA-4]MCD2198723.1 2-phospho-L-lactate guanylyltransferase [Halobacterium sp. KA-4]
MRTLVPFDPTNPNTRLASLLSDDERRAFATAMLSDVLDAVRRAGGTPTVLATAPLEADVDAPVTVDDRPLSVAVNDALAELPAVVVMADLALATPAAIQRLYDADADVVVAPGRGGGTNALVVRHREFSVDYHGTSFLDHLAAADAVGASVETVDSFRLAVDVDEPADLLDVLVHGNRGAAGWLRDAGFRVAVVDGTPEVVRD